MLINKNGTISVVALKGKTGAKVVSTEYIGKDANGGNIYKQTFDDGTTAQFVAPKGEKGEKGNDGGYYDGIYIKNNKITNLPVEIGGLQVYDYREWDYDLEYHATMRVRLSKGFTLRLNAGDKIGLSDYSNARFYVGGRCLGNTYLSVGWNTADFTVPCSGEYVVLIANVTEVVQTNAYDLGKLLFVEIREEVEKTETIPEVKAKKVKAINHRGYNTIAPENTLPAYRLSKKNGFDFVECDLRWTSDGVPVLLHDASINRTARNVDGTEISGTVNIADITYEQALSYDFGIWKGGEYSGTKIPTFAEFISLCRNLGLHPYIEIEGAITTEQAQTLINIVKDYGLLNSVSWISNNSGSLSKIVYIHRQARVGLVVWNTFTSAFYNKLMEIKTPTNDAFLDIRYDLVTDECIEYVKSVGIGLEVWDANTADILLSLNPYVSGATTDVLNIEKVLYDANIE